MLVGTVGLSRPRGMTILGSLINSVFPVSWIRHQAQEFPASSRKGPLSKRSGRPNVQSLAEADVT